MPRNQANLPEQLYPIRVNLQLARHSFSDGWSICGSFRVFPLFASIRVHSRFNSSAFAYYPGSQKDGKDREKDPGFEPKEVIP
jgi:hypothetical protein